ncbi:acyltransferase family protein [Pseudomonas sp. EA_105y_Pfl2_R69]|uniref:acyltransferase family protein n=1 Tax=Pseudomonas sp. EA_105y_Pfl2_R69 TaxID=3088683 RepID=UPI0030DA9001
MNNKIQDIEWLRGVAILLVVIHHANINLFVWSTPGLQLFYTYFGGTVGVDIFFAISGFVIAKDLLPRLERAANGELAAREIIAFWIRRVWRLLPSAWLWLAIILFLVVFFNSSGAFGGFRTNFEATVAAVLQVANFRLAEAFGRFEYGASAVYWSLSLEEQFYLIFPLAAILLRKYLIFLVMALALWQLFSVRSGLDMFAICFRTDALCLGVMLAIFSNNGYYAIFNPMFLRCRLVSAGLVFVLLMCILALGSNALHIVNIRLSLIALISALLVWIASFNAGYLSNFSSPLQPAMLWLGSRSYAIYLIHMPAFYLTREIWFRTDAAVQGFNENFFYPFVITAFLLIIVLSELNYRLLEAPLRDYGKRAALRIRDGSDGVADMSDPVRSQ